MKRIVLVALTAIVVTLVASAGQMEVYADWPGVDEAVVKKFAEQAGRPPRDPYINTAQGDLLLFCFLCAGTVGGFIAGYYFRALFPPKTKGENRAVASPV